MPAEPSSVVERIKAKLDIVDEIGAIVPLRKSGKAFKGLCPFHGERTPSFYVFPETGTWRCFGCNEGGDLLTFVEKQQGLDFREALALLAERAGIPLADVSHAAGGALAGVASPETAIRKRLRALNEAAAIWFHAQLLQASEAQYARSYLTSRGVSNESIALWRLGYAPDGDALARYLLSQSYSVAELVEAGLARTREATGGGLYDYFRHRLIFPIRDARGQTIAFGGRELGGGHPKYLNTPQTVLFDKSATLFGLDLARDAIRRQDRVVLVEGYMDAIVPHQYGSRNVVAVIGSAITEKHIQQIKKLTRRVTLALDPDAAGESATIRGITVAQHAFDRVLIPIASPSAGPAAGAYRKRGEPHGMVRFEEQADAEITVARLPAGEDPDEFVRRDPAGWQRAIERAEPLIDFIFETQMAGLALDTPQGKKEACRRILPAIAEVRDRELSGAYVHRLAVRLRLDYIDLQREVDQIRRRVDREARAKPPRTSEDTSQAGAASGEAASSTKGSGEVVSKSLPLQHEGATARYSASSAAASPPGAAGGGSATTAGGLVFEQAQEEYCVGLLLEAPTTWVEMRAILEEGDFSDGQTRALFAALAVALRSADDPAEVALDEVVRRLDPLLRETARRAQARAASARTSARASARVSGRAFAPESADGDDAATDEDRETPDDPYSVEEGPALLKRASQAAYRLKRMRLKVELAELDHLMRDAEAAGDGEALRALVRRKQHLLAQRHTIDEATSLQA
jgi:DNA primase